MTKDGYPKPKLSTNNDEARVNMLKQQIRTWDVLDPKILNLFSQVLRENFVPTYYKDLAYADISIPIAHGQSMMNPKEEARVLQALNIEDKQKVLLLGVDSGYLLTLLSLLSHHVYYVDNDLESFENIKHKIARYNIQNTSLVMGSLHHGWQDFSPFDVIFLTGSLPQIPEILKNALANNGRLFVVTGINPAMKAMIVTRLSENSWNEKKLFETDRPRLLDTKEPDQFIF